MSEQLEIQIKPHPSRRKIICIALFMLSFGLFVVIVAGFVRVFLFLHAEYSHTAEDRGELSKLGNEFINAFGRGDTEAITAMSCADGEFAHLKPGTVDIYKGMKSTGMVSWGVDYDSSWIDRPVSSISIVAVVPKQELEDGTVVPLQYLSQLLQFVYRNDSWCLLGRH